MATNQNDQRNQQSDNRSKQQSEGIESSKKETNPNNPTASENKLKSNLSSDQKLNKDENKKQSPGMDYQNQSGKKSSESLMDEDEDETPSDRTEGKSDSQGGSSAFNKGNNERRS